MELKSCITSKLVFKCLYQIIALRFSQMRIRDNDFPACERSVIGNLVKDFLIFRNILAEKLSKLLANLLGLRPSKVNDIQTVYVRIFYGKQL